LGFIVRRGLWVQPLRAVIVSIRSSRHPAPSLRLKRLHPPIYLVWLLHISFIIWAFISLRRFA